MSTAATDDGELGEPLTRRRLVKLGGGGAAALSFAGLGPLGALAARRRRDPLLRSSYLDLRRRRFRVGRHRHRLKLIAVEDLPGIASQRRLQGHEHAFMLHFRGPARDPLLDGIRTLRHPQFGRFRLYISQVGKTEGRQHYAVVVNRTHRRAKPPR